MAHACCHNNPAKVCATYSALGVIRFALDHVTKVKYSVLRSEFNDGGDTLSGQADVEVGRRCDDF